MRSIKYLIFVLTIQSCFAQFSYAEDSSDKLNSISKFAKENCEEVQQSGDAESFKIKGNVKAGLSSLFKNFGDVGGSGDVEGEVNKFVGILQPDLNAALKDVRVCKQNIINILIPRLFKSGEAEGNPTHRMIAANDPLPPNPCGGLIEPESLTVLLGNDAFIALAFPHTILQIAGRNLIFLNRHPDGSLGLNLELIGKNGLDVAKIVDNVVTMNESNYIRLIQERSHIKVFSLEGEDILDLTYINPHAVKITASLLYKNTKVDISDDEINVNNGKFALSESCMAGSRYDIVIGQLK